MSYTRGDLYTYVSGDDCDCDPDDCPPQHSFMNVWVDDRADGIGYASSNGADHAGVAVRLDRFDEVVVMRFAELVDEGLLAGTVERARQSGNFGAYALREALGEDMDAKYRAFIDAYRAESGGSG